MSLPLWPTISISALALASAVGFPAFLEWSANVKINWVATLLPMALEADLTSQAIATRTPTSE